MKYLIKMEIIKSGSRIEEMKSKAKKKSLYKYEIHCQGDIFFADNLKMAKAIRGIIRGTSKRLKATIYQKIQNTYYPLHTHQNKTQAEIEEIISLGILSTENKEGE